MNNMTNEVKAVCRKCGKSAPADKFVLDNSVKMMICPSCVAEMKGKLLKPKPVEPQPSIRAAPQTKSKPADWDQEDDYLDKLKKKKDEAPKAIIERIDDVKVRYTCFKCHYNFIYNTAKDYPKVCPYCKMPISRMK